MPPEVVSQAESGGHLITLGHLVGGRSLHRWKKQAEWQNISRS